MKKIVLSFFTLVLMVSLLTLILLLNSKFFFTPTKAKSYLKESGTYQLVAGFIRDEFIKQAKIDIKEGDSLEILNRIVNTDVSKIMTEDLVDQFFMVVMTNKESAKIAVDYSPIVSEYEAVTNSRLIIPNIVNNNYVVEFSLHENIFSRILFNFNLLLSLSIGLALVAIIIIILIENNNHTRLGYLSFSFITISFILLVFGLIVVTGLIKIDLLINIFRIPDIKIINGIRRAVIILLSEIRNTLVIETVLAALIGSILLFVRKSFHTDKIDIIAKAINK